MMVIINRGLYTVEEKIREFEVIVINVPKWSKMKEVNKYHRTIDQMLVVGYNQWGTTLFKGSAKTVETSRRRKQ